MAASSPAVRRRAPARGRIWTRLAVVAAVVGSSRSGAALLRRLGRPLADGTRIAGIDVGGLSPADATTLLQRRSDRLARVPVTFVAGTERFEITPRALGVQVDWRAAVATPSAQGAASASSAATAGSSCSSSRRISSRRSAPTTPRSTTSSACSRRRSTRGTAKRSSCGAGCTSRSRRDDRPLPRPRGGAAAARPVARVVLARACRAARADRRAADHRRVADREAAARVAHHLGAGDAWSPARPACACRAGASRRCSTSTTLRFSGTSADRYFTQLERHRRPAAEGRGLRRLATARSSVVPSEPGLTLDVPRSAARVLAAAERPANRVATLVLEDQQPKRTTAQAQAMGITGTVGSYETIYGGEREPDPQRAARRASRRQQADRARRDVLVQRDDRRALGGEGLPRSARDRERRAADRARRRRLPGLDDRVQRGVRGRPAHHRAHEPLALHLALSARARRDGQLSRHRPEVRERHAALAAAAHVGRLRRRSPSRSTGRRSTAASTRSRHRFASSPRRRCRRPSTRR